MELKDNEYRCRICKNIYEKEISDDEAGEEMQKIWGAYLTKEDCDIVCDDCYKKLFN